MVIKLDNNVYCKTYIVIYKKCVIGKLEKKRLFFYGTDMCMCLCTECVGRVVDSIEAAQTLKGCNKIQGPLEIQIMGGSELDVYWSVCNLTCYHLTNTLSQQKL